MSRRKNAHKPRNASGGYHDRPRGIHGPRHERAAGRHGDQNGEPLALRTPNAAAPESSAVETPDGQPVFTADAVELQRRMRFNPLRMLTPESLSQALDQFDIGILSPGARLWDAMTRRDDTLSFLKPQLEDSIASKPWGVFLRQGADPVEAARHKAALDYFYDHVTATDAFDRNIRGGRHLLIRQMMSSASYQYAVHHFIWNRQPGQSVQVSPGKDGQAIAVVPALTATMEHVPLMYFENTSGQLRFLPMGGFGVRGEELDWNGEWMVTTGQGIMFAASICYVFKRLAFQDWTVFNERYASNKVIGQTNAQRDSEPGRAMANIVAGFNGDQGIVLYESQPGDKPPISLLGPQGTTSVDLFERFLTRQDSKLGVMYRGSDRANVAGEKKDNGITAQIQETERLEAAHCQRIADACREGIDRQVIRFCFGEGVEPLAYFGLPDMDAEDATQLRESAGFLSDRGLQVDGEDIAGRLGITLTENADEALRSAGQSAAGDLADPADPSDTSTANSRKLARLEQLVKAALHTANGNPNHDGKGRFAHLTGKEGNWESLGLPSAEDMPATSGQRPERISREAAMEKLSSPYAKEDPIGNAIGFGTRLKEHLETHSQDARAEFLPHMEASIVRAAEIWHENTDKGPRFRHIGVFTHADGKKHFAVISHRLGETTATIVTGTPKTLTGVNQYRKGTLLHVGY